jgi:hypothetical protein
VLYVKVHVKASEESENCLRQRDKFIKLCAGARSGGAVAMG